MNIASVSSRDSGESVRFLRGPPRRLPSPNSRKMLKYGLLQSVADTGKHRHQETQAHSVIPKQLRQVSSLVACLPQAWSSQ